MAFGANNLEFFSWTDFKNLRVLGPRFELFASFIWKVWWFVFCKYYYFTVYTKELLGLGAGLTQLETKYYPLCVHDLTWNVVNFTFYTFKVFKTLSFKVEVFSWLLFCQLNWMVASTEHGYFIHSARKTRKKSIASNFHVYFSTTIRAHPSRTQIKKRPLEIVTFLSKIVLGAGSYNQRLDFVGKRNQAASDAGN